MKKSLRIIATAILIIYIFGWPLYIYYNEIDSKEKEDKQWTGIITLWDFPRLNVNTGTRYGWINDKIKRFEKSHPGVYIELTPIGWEKGPIKLEVAAKTGNLPDIAPVGCDFKYMNEDILEPLNGYFTKNELAEFKYQSLKAVTYNDKMWGVPFMMTTYGMYLNMEMFRERSIEPPVDGNWTYDEFIKKMKKLTWDSDNDGEIDKYGFVSFIKPNYYNIWGIILSDGAEIINDNKEYVFSGDKALKGIKKVVKLKNEYKVTPKEFGLLDENKAWEMFYNGKIAAYPTGSWAKRVLENRYDKGEGFEFSIANYPIGDRKIPITLNNSVSAYGVFKQEDKDKLDMCMEFIKFIIQDKYQYKLEDLGVFPAKRDIENLYKNDKNMRKLKDSLTYTKTLPKHKKWKEIDRILQNQIRLAIIGKKSSKEALIEANNQIANLLK
ncbi:MAG: sugar ABC transporter substrate-binding protein [Firmicutes bacterium]|nr:sugar ABC transporter substrate-binding protein [Bacillota bacterium]